MGNNLFYYGSLIRLKQGRNNLTVYTKARNKAWANYYAKKWLTASKKEGKITDTILLDERNEKYLLRRVRNTLLKLPKEGVWRIEEERGNQYIGGGEEAAQRKDNSAAVEKTARFPEDDEAQQHLIEALMNSADS
jgi:myo-inositol-hexaphosphate 3-phosphohydrolase